MGFTNDQYEVLGRIDRAAGVLSLIGCLVIIGLFVYFRRLRTQFNELVLYLTCTNIAKAFADIFARSPIYHYGFCQLQGFLREFASVSAALWSGSIAIYVFMTLVMAKKPNDLKYFVRYIGVLNWGAPLIMSLGLARGPGDSEVYYGVAGQWCWISAEWSVLRLVSYYVPIWVMFLLMLVLYCMVAVRLFEVFRESKSHLDKGSRSRSSRNLQRMGVMAIFYLLMYFLTWIWGTINRITEFTSTSPYWLVGMHSFFSPIWGFSNSLVFVTHAVLTLRAQRGSSDSRTSDHDQGASYSATSHPNAEKSAQKGDASLPEMDDKTDIALSVSIDEPKP